MAGRSMVGTHESFALLSKLHGKNTTMVAFLMTMSIISDLSAELELGARSMSSRWPPP